MTATHKLFVYGTLQRDYWNHKRAMASQGEVKFVAEATTRGRFLLASQGIPFVFRQSMFVGTAKRLTKPFLGRIKGELFDIDDAVLKACDRLEGHPHAYRRELVAITLDNGETTTAWAYFYQRKLGYDLPGDVFVAPDGAGVLAWRPHDDPQPRRHA
jgi:gamma-glutamylcyclotransferase (GGCT)/AIG2-like uncharacterized protein YtfP